MIAARSTRLEMIGPMGHRCVHSIRVRYAECDRQDVVFNPHYLAYFDMSMTELFRAALGGYDVMTEAGADIVLAQTELTFHGSARFDDELELSVAVLRMGDSSLVCEHQVRRRDELLTSGTTRHVFVETDTMNKCSIPGWVREALEAFVLDGG
jgi:acyl-CoA thioester hydrolase